MSNLPKGDQNRLQGLGENALRIELTKIESLQGRARKAQEDARRFIMELLAKKEDGKSNAIEQNSVSAEKERRRAIRLMWDAPYGKLRNLALAQGELNVDPHFKTYGDAMHATGAAVLHTMATNALQMKWVKHDDEVFEPRNERNVCVFVAKQEDTQLDEGVTRGAMTRQHDGKRMEFLCVNDAPITPEYAAIKLAEEIVTASQANGIFKIKMGKATDPVGSTAEPDLVRMGTVMEGAELFAHGGIKGVAETMRQRFDIRSQADVQRLAQDQSTFAWIVRQINRPITRKHALSKAEQSIRSHIALFALMSQLPLTGTDYGQMQVQQLWNPMVPVDNNHPRAQDIREMLESVGVDPKGIEFATCGSEILFLARRDAVPADSPLLRYENEDYEDTLDLAVNLGKESNESAIAKRNEREWVGGGLKSKEQIRSECIRHDIETQCSVIEDRYESVQLSAKERSQLSLVHAGVKKLHWYDLAGMPSEYDLHGTAAVKILGQDKMNLLMGYASDEVLPVLVASDAHSTAEWRTISMYDALGAMLNRENSRIGKMAPVITKILSGDRFDAEKQKLSKKWTVEEALARPVEFIRAMTPTTRTITRKQPKSRAESLVRAYDVVSPMDAGDISGKRQQIVEALWPLADLQMSLNARHVPHDEIREDGEAGLFEILGVLDDSLPTAADGVTFGKTGNTYRFVCRKNELPDALSSFVSADNEETLDLVVNLDLQDEASLETDAWVSGTLPSIEQLERELFEQRVVADKFFPITHDKDEGDPTDDEPESVLAKADAAEKNELPLPRLKALRNTLLKNRWKAQFTIDDRHMAPAKPSYAEAEPGHYVLVSLPEAKLQVLISNDRSKGTYVIRNLIDPAEFTTISIDEFLAKYGATRVKFDSIPQFRGALETEIGEQIKDPITIYPVASSFKTPLHGTRFPNPEAVSLLRRDFEMAARIAGKASIEDLTVGDFANIESGPARWSFGGVAGGASYLDRLATELGLDASDMPVSRERVLENIDSIAANTEHGTPPATPENAARWKETVLQPIKQYDFRQRALDLLLSELSDAHLAKKSDEPAGLAEHRRETKRTRRKNGNGKQHPEESAAQ